MSDTILKDNNYKIRLWILSIQLNCFSKLVFHMQHVYPNLDLTYASNTIVKVLLSQKSWPTLRSKPYILLKVEFFSIYERNDNCVECVFSKVHCRSRIESEITYSSSIICFLRVYHITLHYCALIDSLLYLHQISIFLSVSKIKS